MTDGESGRSDLTIMTENATTRLPPIAPKADLA